ncbi:MAG: ATP-dependent zinc metalloprotease FtsH [Clostridia bacterium]|nr:ATP-dependent zinc metalloprotease FtsH [Clostridia bacterium]
MEKKKNNPWKSILTYGIILVLAVVLIYWFVSRNNKGKEISYTQFQEMVLSGEVAEIDVYGYTVRIRTVGGVEDKKFPKKLDAYCTFMSVNELTAFINDYNNIILEAKVEGHENFNKYWTKDAENNIVLKEGVVLIEATYSFESESWFSTLLPYLSIAIIVVMGIFLFKSMSGNSKGFGFGKSKAKLVVSSNVKFKDVAGADEEKQELKEVVEFLKNPARFTEVGARIPKGVLLVGPPGTGKTLLAKAVAGESKVPFFSISGSDFVELYVGVGASRVRDLFDTAKANAPCIVFIDEIDAVGRQRGAGMGGGNDEREQTLNQMLVEMDGFESNSGIIVLAATNRADVLDPALTRPGRFDRQIYVHLPDVKGREEIIKVHAKNKKLADDVDFQRIARLTSGLAGADIENVLNEAALLCARDGRYKITMVDIQEGLNKALMGPKKVSRVIKEQDKIITAIHEAGHAIIAQTLPNCDNVQEISIIPRGQAGGYTLTFDEEDRTHMTKKKLLDTITMMLGGRSAEEIMLDDITTGASNDIERATKVARKMVAEWGMTDEIGLISFGDGGEIFVGRNYQKQVPYSDELASKIDVEVKKMIDTAHKQAKEILSSKREVIEKVRDILLEKETIYKEEFEMLYNGASIEEVKIAIDQKEAERRAVQEKAKKEALEETKTRDIQQRVATAEALAKAGVISKQDLENIKKEAETEFSAMNNEQSQQTATSKEKPEDETDKKD